MAEFNLNDMEQARRRVMEMQRRSQNYTGGGRRANDPPQSGRRSGEGAVEGKPPHGEAKAGHGGAQAGHGDQTASQMPAQEREPTCERAEKPTAASSGDALGGLLNLGGLGSDRTLILLMLVLLGSEKADRLLMLALLYCAL